MGSYKKKILFIMNNLHCGGAEKALVSLLQNIDYSRFEVDLFLFKNEGLFLNQVPENVKILPSPKFYPYFDMSFKEAIFENFKKGNFNVIWNRLLAGVVNLTEKNPSIREQKVWKHLKKIIRPIEKEYDIAIGYLEKTPNYFCVDKVKAIKKIGFIHNDYDQLKMSKVIDYPYFHKLDKIVTVSKECKLKLEENFPDMVGKFEILHNITSAEIIKGQSIFPVNLEKKGTSIVSVGRLHHQKGFDLAIQACKILRDKNFDVYWYVIGEGEERHNLENQIKVNQLQDRFVLLGIKENPYPYLKYADLFLQTSRFEGKSVAIDEAKIMQKPIVVTNFSTVNDQIQSEINGLIVEMNPFSIADGIIKIVEDEDLRSKLIENLTNEKIGNEDEIVKFYEIINNI